MPTFLIKARDGSDQQRFATFCGTVRRPAGSGLCTQINVGVDHWPAPRSATVASRCWNFGFVDIRR